MNLKYMVYCSETKKSYQESEGTESKRAIQLLHPEV